jgi:hypothetical protein
VNKTAIQRFGFEIQALKDQTNTNIGTWAITQSTRTQIITHTVGGTDLRSSVTHKQAGTLATIVGQIEWQFNWTAPPINEGPITFYYATNCTNNNALNSGDQIFTNQFKLQPSTGASINEIINENEVVAFFNSNGGYFDLQYNLNKDEMVKVNIVDASGKQVYASSGQSKSKGVNTDKIALNGEISSGIYFVNIVAGNNRVTKKVSIIR